MNTLGDSLNEAFAADAARQVALDSGGIVGAIRRRRAVSAAGMGAAAVVGIGAIGAVWWLTPGGRFASPAQPAPAGSCTAAELYLPPNSQALGYVDVLFRAYVDLRPNAPHYGVVVVTPDGTITRIEKDANGDYAYNGRVIVGRDLPESWLEAAMVYDYDSESGNGTDWDGLAPFVKDYEWTTTVPSQAPDGIDVLALVSVLGSVTSISGLGYSQSAVPDGATTDAIVTTTIGSTEYPLTDGASLPTLAYTDNVVSVALRVSGLPDGGTFTITTTHQTVDPALTACASGSTSASETASPTISPTADSSPSAAPSSAEDDALTGPESAVFACGTTLPPELEGTLGLDVTWETGRQVLAEGYPEEVDLGSGGIVVRGDLTHGGAPEGELEAANWSMSIGVDESLAVFDTVVAVKDNVIVGFSSTWQAPTPADGISFRENGDGTETIAAFVADVGPRMAPCPGIVEGDLDGATTVVLLGTGAIGGPYTFAWTVVPQD